MYLIAVDDGEITERETEAEMVLYVCELLNNGLKANITEGDITYHTDDIIDAGEIRRVNKLWVRMP